MAMRSKSRGVAASQSPDTAGLSGKQPCVVAFAIEDNVGFSCHDGNSTQGFLKEFPRKRRHKNFFVELRKLIKSALGEFIKASAHPRDPEAFVRSIKSIVVSAPGVIESNETILQLPLWNWPDTPVAPEVIWEWRGESRRYFNFKSEICDIFEELVGISISDEKFRSQLHARIFVINDVTAAAACEYYFRQQKKAEEDFVFIKAHNGINAGVIEKEITLIDGVGGPSLHEAPKIRITHPEAGHFLPLLHDFDIDTGFSGVCEFHGCCLEGMIATHAFYTRAKTLTSERIASWQKLIGNLEGSNAGQEQASERLIDRLVGHTFSQFNDLGVDIIAHYVAQLVHRLAVGSLAPERIVIGGRMISAPVLMAIREKVKSWANGYPRWAKLDSGIEQFIVASSAAREDEPIADLIGAFILAQARAGVPSGKWAVLTKSQLLSTRTTENDDNVVSLLDVLRAKKAKESTPDPSVVEE